MPTIRFILFSELHSFECKRLVLEYTKRLQKYAKVELIEIKKYAKESIEQIKHKYKGSYMIILDEKGKVFDSLSLSGAIDCKIQNGISEIVFVIGDADGFREGDITKADMILSLSTMTFPHELCAVMLCEQVYRAFSILNNHPYHRE